MGYLQKYYIDICNIEQMDIFVFSLFEYQNRSSNFNQSFGDGLGKTSWSDLRILTSTVYYL